MNEDIFAGQWKQMRGEVKSWWGKLAADDLDRIDGQKDRLIGWFKRNTVMLANMPSKRWSGASRNTPPKREGSSPI